MQNEGREYEGVMFKQGDIVMVMNYADDFQFNAMGDGRDWQETWNAQMNDAIFQQFEIDFIDESGVHFVWQEHEESSCFAYPLCVLENLTAKMKEAA